MTPLLASLAARGIALRAAAGKLLATPVAALTPGDRALILAHKAELLALLAAPQGDDADREAAIAAALEQEAADGKGPFAAGPVRLREWAFAMTPTGLVAHDAASLSPAELVTLLMDSADRRRGLAGSAAFAGAGSSSAPPATGATAGTGCSAIRAPAPGQRGLSF